MTSRKIPRWGQCGIFSIRPWWALPGWALFLCLTLHGQSGPRPTLHKRAARPVATPDAQTENLTILALRVAFTREIDDNLSTTGDGTFLMELTEADSLRCDGFLVDPPPHDVLYFDAQLEAMANYFESVSNGKVTFNRDSFRVYPEGNDPIVLEGNMASYRPVADEDSSDALLVALFAESILAAADSEIGVLDYDLVVVFHAGLGQDFAYPALDPTPKDIPSAYIDSAMIADARNKYGVPVPPYVKGGLLLPEGQNHIYYDIVKDIFPEGDDYCDVQIGLTGTFALLVGHALGFPPLYDTDDGETGVGVFGLMDVGSNNGQGVIPAPPTAWTRDSLDWKKAIELEGDFALAARHLDEGQIGRISLSTSEYFLVENRLNWVPGLPGVDLDSLRYRNRTAEGYGSYTLPPYFDYLIDSAEVTVDTATGVITSVPNYDLGLPGSGLLIWHVDESRYNLAMQGINDDPQARAVALVEADGAVDIGFPTTALFGNPDQGWRWDLWYAGNEGFFTANPDREANNPQGLLSFDSDTRPSTHLNSGAESGVAVSRIGPAGDILDFVVGDVNVTRLPEGSRLLGFNGEKWLYARGDSLFMAGVEAGETFVATLIPESSHIVSESDPVVGDASSAFWVVDSTQVGYTARRYLGNGSPYPPLSDTVRVEAVYFNDGLLFIGTQDSVFPESPDTTYIKYYQVRYDDGLPVVTSWGYLEDHEMRSPIIIGPPGEEGVDPGPDLAWAHFIPPSLGDVDGDGLDEIVAFHYRMDIHEFVTTYRMTAVNSNGTVLDGFPLHRSFIPSPVLISNLMDDIRPELVVVESGDIAIYSPEGQPLDRLGLHAEPGELFLMHLPPDSVGLANGDRIHWFEPEEQNPQWVTPQGRHSRSRYSLNDGTIKISQPAVLDQARVYNYPNPVTEGRTTIRFYTGQASRATIRIYTVDGLLVARSGKIPNLATNDYNEWVWDVGNNPSGLYYAVVMVEGAESADRQTALVKIAVVR